ncbi:MAG TPA: TraM recognition domain-containing protein [Phycisphaerae bacterium]|nr:TraM recognition domain-containing protein [Phycisphaerae bacterium]
MFGRLLKRKSPPRARPLRWELSDELLRWSSDDVWTIRDAVEGTLILGATGSGKTSGSGRMIATSMLSAGFGGLVLTAKADERALWESYCRETNRSGDLVVVGPDAGKRFNFLDHELNRKGEGAGLTENLCNLFSQVMEIKERSATSGGGREDGTFWKQGALKGMRNAVDLVSLATGTISVPDLVNVMLSAPLTRAEIREKDWQEKSYCFRCLVAADKRDKTPRQEHDFGVVADYYLIEWPNLAERTRSVIQATFMGWADLLVRGLLRELFCTDTSVTPEDVERGRIILLDLPVKEFGEVGQFAQVLFKYSFERSIERRNVAVSPRPVFLWADEAQTFVTSYDMQFQTTCRAARVATVLLSQNYSNFIAALGGNEKARAETDSLLANLNTRVFHVNGDPVTNNWASSLIGRSRQFMMNGNSSSDADDQLSAIGLDWFGRSGTTTAGFSETIEFEVQPREFTRLRAGGPANGWIVDGIVFQNGRTFAASDRSWLKTTFRQKA